MLSVRGKMELHGWPCFNLVFFRSMPGRIFESTAYRTYSPFETSNPLCSDFQRQKQFNDGFQSGKCWVGNTCFRVKIHTLYF